MGGLGGWEGRRAEPKVLLTTLEEDWKREEGGREGGGGRGLENRLEGLEGAGGREDGPPPPPPPPPPAFPMSPRMSARRASSASFRG